MIISNALDIFLLTETGCVSTRDVALKIGFYFQPSETTKIKISFVQAAIWLSWHIWILVDVVFGS